MAEEIESLAHYRNLIEQHRANKDPLIMVRVADLEMLLDSFGSFGGERPRVKRKAKSLKLDTGCPFQRGIA